MKKKLLPIIVMQIALPYMSSGGDEPSFEGLIREWQHRFREYECMHVEQEHVMQERAAAEAIYDEQKKLEPILSNMAQEVLNATNASFMQDERERFHTIQVEADRLSASIANEELERDLQQAIVKKLSQQLRQLEQRIKQHEKDNYGLADLVTKDRKLEGGEYEN